MKKNLPDTSGSDENRVIQPPSSSDDEYGFADEKVGKSIEPLPDINAVTKFNGKAEQAIALLKQAKNSNKSLNTASQKRLLEWLEQGLTLLRQQELAKESYSVLASNASVVENMYRTYDGLEKTLEARGANDAQSIIAEIWQQAKLGLKLSDIKSAQQN